MKRFDGFSVYAQDFKCFGTKPQGFHKVHRLNLIIGRNNTGKSAMLDLIRFAVSQYDLTPYSYKHKVQPTVTMSQIIDEAIIKRCFPENIRGGDIPGRTHRDYGMGLVGARMCFEQPSSGSRNGKFSIDKEYVAPAQNYLVRIMQELENPFTGLRFTQIAAERDILPEADSDELILHSNGAGATNIVQRVINDEGLPSELVEETLRADLNRIMGPDANFTRIAAQRTIDDKWIVYLDERSKGRISLGDSGSGLKTILLVLISMLVMPQLDQKKPDEYVFAFEELENNLHPGLQRRLLKYVQDKISEVGATVFATTHSPAVIDMFSRADDAQILHVIHDGQMARVIEVAGSKDGHGVLDDLDVKASDLLQANGIVWVEGISDVIYVRGWIELYCKEVGMDVPVEGSEYAFMEYGGRCLKHLDFSAACAEELSTEDAKWLLPALSVSRNTYVVMDSDKRGGTSKVNETKLSAAAAASGSWITEGREIENYLPPDVAENMFGKPLAKYDSVSSVHEEYKKTRLDKKKTAAEAVSMLTLENWCHRNLKEEIRKLVDTISEWNPVYIEEDIT